MKSGSKTVRALLLGFVLVSGLALAGCDSNSLEPGQTSDHSTTDNSPQAQKNAKAYPNGAAAGNGEFNEPIP